MKARVFSLLIAVYTVLTVLAVPLKAANTDSRTESLIYSSLTESSQSSLGDYINHTLTDSAGNGSAEWCIIALSRYAPSEDYSAYCSALREYAGSASGLKPTDRQRIALAFSAMGTDIDYVKDTLASTVGELGIMSLIYGLVLANSSADLKETDTNAIVDDILDLRLSDGGWALSGSVSDVDVTAMALQALAPYGNRADISAVTDKAVLLLSSRQLENGDFASWGTRNCESTAQVLSALCALGISPEDTRFVKNGNTLFDALALYKTEGGYSHKIGGRSNDYARVQTLCAFVSVWLAENGGGRLLEFPSNGQAAVIPSTTAETQAYVSQAVPATAGTSKAVTTSLHGENTTSSVSEQSTSAEPSNIQESTDTTASLQVVSGESETEQSVARSEHISYKTVSFFVLAAVALLVLIFLILSKKLNKRTLAIFAVVTAVLFIILAFTDIKSPEEYYAENPSTGRLTGSVLMSIKCNEAIDYYADNDGGANLPDNGIILDNASVELFEGDTVADILLRVSKEKKIPVEFSNGSGVYVEGIDGLYEFDCSPVSGWKYSVNGVLPGFGCSEYILKDGDIIEWYYSVEY